MPELIDSVSADKVRRATTPLIGILQDYRGRDDNDLAYLRVGDAREIIRVLCEVGIARAVTREETAVLSDANSNGNEKGEAMSETAMSYEAPVFEGDLRVVVVDDGVEIQGVDSDTAAFLLMIQQDDLAVVRESRLNSDTERMYRGFPELGQEIANRVAQVVRKAVEQGLISYSGKTWAVDWLKVRNALFPSRGR